VCKHTFNKPAIVEFLRQQPEHRAKCPQTGCSKVWTSQFHSQTLLYHLWL
jgi:hypothetical protein